MTTVSSPRAVKSVFQEVDPKFDEIITKLKDEIGEEAGNFNHEEFWTNFVAAVKIISHEATKLSMAFSKPPVPTVNECQSLVDSVMTAVETCSVIFHGLPSSKGSTRHEMVYSFVVSLVLSIKDLCLRIKNSSNSHLPSVGNVWEKCEAVETLPKDNKDAVLLVFDGELTLVEDAANELTDAIDNDNEDLGEAGMVHAFLQNGIRLPCPDKWSPSDLPLVHHSLGLIKAYRACLRKTIVAISARGNPFEDRPIAELDEVANIVKSSSSLVDDLVLSLYPPTSHSAVRCHASLVRDKSKNLLSIVQTCHFFTETDKIWLDFLCRAIDHNSAQIDDRVLID